VTERSQSWLIWRDATYAVRTWARCFTNISIRKKNTPNPSDKCHYPNQDSGVQAIHHSSEALAGAPSFEMDPNMFWHPGVQWFFPAWRENDESTIGSWEYFFKVLESLQIHRWKYPRMSTTNCPDLLARWWGSWIGKASPTYPKFPADHWMGRWRTCEHNQVPTSLRNNVWWFSG